MQLRSVVTRCWRTQREQGGGGGSGQHRYPEKRRGLERENGGFVRIGAEVVFHLDVLKPTLQEGVGTHTKKQMSLDLEDL